MRESLQQKGIKIINLTPYRVSAVSGLDFQEASPKTGSFGTPRASKNTFYLVDEARLSQREDFVWFDAVVSIAGFESVLATWKNHEVRYSKGP